MMRKVGMWSDVRGIIGSRDWQKPTEKWITNKKGEKTRINYFVLLCQNTMAGKDQNGYFPQEQVTVYLPQGEAGRKVFKKLTAGRRVLVKGPLQMKPRVSNTNGDVFANPEIQAQEIEFLDQPLNRTISSFMRNFTESSSALTEILIKIREEVINVENFPEELTRAMTDFAVSQYHEGRTILDEEGVPK
jgi:hypothetical protein